MNQNIKNILGVAIVIAVLLLGFAAMSYVNSYSQSIQPSSFRSFSVTGQGKTTAIPDVAEFSFTVLTQGGTDLASLQSENADKMNKAIDYVKSEGVESKDIKTQYYNINPRYQTYDCRQPVPLTGQSVSSASASPCPPPEIVGYTVTQSVDVKIRDFSKIGDIMGNVVKNGANEVGSLSFTLDDPTKPQDEARAEAIAKAKAKALSIAQEGGFHLGRLLGITESGPTPVYNYAMKSMGIGGAVPEAAPVAPTVEAGSQDVNVSVTLQYEIQ